MTEAGASNLLLSPYYLACLSHASYLVADTATGRAVVVDPQRDVDAYLREAESRRLTITHVIESHFHADFLSGHLELAHRTGAEICYGSAAEGVAFPIRKLHDGERLSLGEVELEVLETPGHTPESICLVVRERPDAPPHAVLTGDTLFIGDVGRPDLLAAVGVTAEDLARRLYHSTRRLLTLPDDTTVLPAHGAGSACGKNLSTETSSTIGDQRRTNHALQPMSEDDFVRLVSEGQPVAPLYFGFDARRNREAHPLLDEYAPPEPLAFDDVLARHARGAVLLDTREAQDFAGGHLRASINVGLSGRFAEYAGDVLHPHDEIVLIGDPGSELEAKVRLARIGFDNVVGYLAEPYAAFLDHPDLVERSSRLTADGLSRVLRAGTRVAVVDLRNQGEIDATGSIPGSRNVPLPQLLDAVDRLERDVPTVVYCAGGYRSAIGASVLARAGFDDVSELVGGYEAWAAAPATAG